MVRLDGVLGVEAREVLADDLVGLVAVDPLGALVPGHHVAVGVEHEDRVVAYVLDQEVEALLAAQRGPCLLAEAPSVVDGVGRPPRQVLGEAQVVRLVAVPRLRRHQRDGAKHALVGDQGDGHGRDQAELAHELEQLTLVVGQRRL